MSDDAYPTPASDVVATLRELYRAQKDSELVDLLARAHPWIDATDYDNWNGGTTFYRLNLDLPVSLFAQLEPRIPEIEQTLQQKTRLAFKNVGNHVISAVTVTPAIVKAAHDRVPGGTEADHLWGSGTLKLFLSHIADHRGAVGELKTELASLGVAAFVAHQDITPSLEWQAEIEKALSSMDAMVAVLTHGFPESNWTDQEIGWALARGIVLIPVRIDVTPYGFMGRHQALTGRFTDVAGLARRIVLLLVGRPETQARATEALVRAIEEAQSWAGAKAASSVAVEVASFSQTQIERILAAIDENPEVHNAFGVPERLRARFSSP